MNIAALQLDTDVESTDEDTLGGGSFILDTGLYPMVVNMAYLDKSAGGAMNINLHLKKADGGNQVFRHTIYITSGDKKGNKPYYVNQAGKKFPLPGYSLVDLITQITADVKLGVVATEKKIVKLWDFQASAEVPREVPVITEMLNKTLLIGMQKHRENKKVKDGDKYVDTNEAREFNEIHKVFHADGYTVAEKLAEADEAVFVETWKDANPSDYVKDTFKPVAGATADTGTTSAAAATATQDIFA